ncbi:MAG: cytochrome c oxidase subunit 3 [Terriglobales bacterium]|jgi:cytochrome c oxidase subunit III
MATTIQPPKLDERKPTSSGNGGGQGSIPPADGRLPAVKDFAPPPASTGIWVLLFSITMTFLAFTSALIVRQGSALDWQHLALPPILYLNTLVLIASSVTLEMGRREVGAFMGPLAKSMAHPGRWLHATLGLGLLFVIGQYVAWLQLRAQGLYLATNPNSSFFYLLTAVHAIHVLGGLGGLVRVVVKLNHSTLKKSTLVATARYWHFMGVLWIYLLLVLWAKI